MVSKKRIFIVTLSAVYVWFTLLGQELEHINRDAVVPTTAEEAMFDMFGEGHGLENEEIDEWQDNTIEEQDDPDSSLATSHSAKNITFTRDDVLNFCDIDKAKIIYKEGLYQAPFQENLKIDKLWLTNLQLPVDSYISKIINFGNVDTNVFSREFYPYEVTLTRLYAGLGEFDKNFAHLSMFKDQLVGIPNLHFRGDFRGQDELIEGFNHRRSEFYFQMDYFYPLKTTHSHQSKDRITLSATYLNTNKNLLARHYLFKDIFVLNNETINENWRFMSFETAWKFAFLNYFISDNTIDSDRSADKIKFGSSGLGIGSQFEIYNHNFVTTYQRNINQVTPSPHSLVQMETSTDNLLSANHRYKYGILETNTDFLLFDHFSKIYTKQNMSLNIYKHLSQTGISHYLYFLTNLSYTDVNRPDIQYRIENHENRDLKGGLGYRSKDMSHLALQPYNSINQRSKMNVDFEIDLLAGQKKITQHYASTTATSFDKEKQASVAPYSRRIGRSSDEFLSVSSDIQAEISYHDFVFLLQNSFEYDNINKSFYLIPNYTNTLDASLLWKMKNDNRMSIGSRMTLLGDVINDSGVLIKSNPVVDAYFSIGITKLFDIKLELNNIYRNMYFGNNILNDFHISSYLIWYFIN